MNPPVVNTPHETIYGKYVGVTYHYTSKKWISKIELLGELYSIGQYETEEEANQVRQAVLHSHGIAIKELLSTVKEKTHRQKLFSEYIHININPNKKIKTSKYAQIYWSKSVNKWESSVNILKERYTIGYYDDEETAYTMNQIVVNNHIKELHTLLSDIPERSFRRKLFSDYIRQNVDSKKPTRASKYKGISYSNKKGVWQCNAYISGENYYVGLYPEEDIAFSVLQTIKTNHRNTIENGLKECPTREERNKWFSNFIKNNIGSERRVKTPTTRVAKPYENIAHSPKGAPLHMVDQSQQFHNQLNINIPNQTNEKAVVSVPSIRENVKLKEELEQLKSQNHILLKQIVTLTEKTTKKRKRNN